MGFWRSLIGLDLVAPGVDPETVAPTFAVDAESVPPEVFGLEAYSAPTAPAARIDRRTAIQVPAVKRVRDLVAGVLGGLPLECFDAQQNRVPWSLFDQPEKNVPRSVTMTRLYEDLLFEEIAWWRVVETSWDDWPTFVKRLKPGRVQVDEDRGEVYVDGKKVTNPDKELIRFDSPTDGLLKAGARAIRTCVLLDQAAANAANGVPAVEYFTPADGADPLDDDEITALLDEHAAARRERRTAYYPASIKYNVNHFDPKTLQLSEQRQHAVLEIARVGGVDPEDVGVSTTSRTYTNQFDRRKAYTDFTLGLYMHATEGRLSMGDISPRGYTARHDLDAFLRSDPAGRYAAYAAGLQVGAIDEDDIARLEGRPAGSVQPRPTAAPTPTPDDPSVIPLRRAQ